MNNWEYLRVSVSYKDDGKLDFVAKRDKTLPSIATHDGMEAHFNIARSVWDAFLEKLKEDGWELTDTEQRNDGRDESFTYKRLKPE